MEIFNIHNLLYKILELLKHFRQRQRYSKDFSLEAFSDVPPLYYRYLQIEVLFKAFKLKYQNNDLKILNLIEEKIVDDDKLLIDKLNEILSTKTKLNKKIESLNQNELETTFFDLLNYRIEIYELINSQKSILLEGSSTNRRIYTNFIKYELGNNIIAQCELLDDILCSFFNPFSHKITLTELVENYNYPNVDLEKIDFDFYYDSF